MKITKHQNTSILPGALYNPEITNDVDIPLAPEESVTADNLPPSARYIYDKATAIKQREAQDQQSLQERIKAIQQRTVGLGEGDSATDWYHAMETDPAKRAEWDRQAFNTTMGGVGVIGTIASAGTMGWVPALLTETAGAAGGYGGYKAGEYLDNKFGTQWIAPTLGFVGGMGSGMGSYKGLVRAGSRGWLRGYGNMYGKQFVSDVVSDALNKSVKNNGATTAIVQPIIRTKVGDIEIDNPNLYYRQGTREMGDDFVQQGIVREGTENHIKPIIISRISLEKKPFKAPMFAKGKLWYGIDNPGTYSDLLVANPSAQMQLATKYANPTTNISQAGVRRIPATTLTSEDVAVYRYLPGYGFKSMNTETPSTSYKFFERPSKLTDAERSGIPKEVRNRVLNGHLKGDDAVRMFNEYGTMFPEDMVRLYRATGTSGTFRPSLDGTAKYSGMWFTDDPRKINHYASQTVKDARRAGVENPIVLEYVDVPKSKLENFKAKNIIKNKDVEFEPLEDFLIPLNHIGRKQVPWEGFTGNLLSDARIPLPTLPPVQKSKIYSQIQQLVPEARERYGLVGRTDISDDAIAGSLYKRAIGLNGEGNGAVWETGEPRLLFRGDTQRYSKLLRRPEPEHLISGSADNSLGNLFLGELPGSTNELGVERYLHRVEPGPFSKETLRLSATGNGIKHGNEILKNIPADLTGAYGQIYSPKTTRSFGRVKLLPARMSVGGGNDVNPFVVRTKFLRDISDEVSVGADQALLKSKGIDYSDGTQKAILKYYRSVLDDAKANNQGLMVSKPNSPFRPDEHVLNTYYALPNFNRQNAKHLFGWDLRRPVQWDVDNIYLKQGGTIKAQPGTKLPNWNALFKANSSGAPFMLRVWNQNKKSIPDWENPDNHATHKMAYHIEDDGSATVYPEVQEINGELVDFTDPKNKERISAYWSAVKNNNTVKMTPEEAEWFTTNYKNHYPGFKQGGKLPFYLKYFNYGK